MSWIKSHRSVAALDLLRSNPNAFLVLYQIAFRARRGEKGNRPKLSMGEAFVGDYAECGLTRHKHRTALAQLQAMGYVATKATNKGTIAKLIDITIFDPNFEEDVAVASNNTASRINSNGQQMATNKKVKNCKKHNNDMPGKFFNDAQSQICSKPTKSLSMYVLKGRKEACEEELKTLRDRGSEYAMGFEYDSKADKLRAIELKTKIKELNRAMQNADG